MDSIRVVLARALAWQPTVEDDDDDDDDGPTNPWDRFSVTRPSLEPEDILTPEELAARLKVPEAWVFEKTRSRCRNPIPSLQLGRYVRFDWQAVVSWLQESAAAEERDEKSRDNSRRR